MAPEKWRRASRLQVLDTVRSGRLRRAQLDDHLWCRWLVGLNMGDPLWEPSTFSQPRERLRGGQVAPAGCARIPAPARERDLRSEEHGTGDGTLIDAWAGQHSFTRQEAPGPSPPPDDPGPPSLDCRGERRTHAPQASTTAPEARRDKKATGQEAKLASLGPGLRAQRHGLVVDPRVPQAPGTAERDAALALAEAIPGPPRVTLGADTNEAPRGGVRERRALHVTPPVAQQTSGRSSARAGRTTRHAGWAVRQRRRKGGEAICGWMKPVGLLRQTRYRGVARVGWRCTCAAAVSNLVRMRTLAAGA